MTAITSISWAVRLIWLENANSCPAILTRKVGQTDLAFGVRWGFISIFKKNVKNVKNVRIIFHGCLMFIVPLHCCQNLTSFTLDVQQWLRMDHTRGSGNWITVITERSMWTHFDGLRTKLLLKIFNHFLIRHFKKVKSHVFWNLKKKRKIRILELCRGSGGK